MELEGNSNGEIPLGFSPATPTQSTSMSLCMQKTHTYSSQREKHKFLTGDPNLKDNKHNFTDDLKKIDDETLIAPNKQLYFNFLEISDEELADKMEPNSDEISSIDEEEHVDDEIAHMLESDSDDSTEDELYEDISPEDMKSTYVICSEDEIEPVDEEEETHDVEHPVTNAVKSKNISVESVNGIYFKKFDHEHATQDDIDFNTFKEKPSVDAKSTPEKIHEYFDSYIVGQEDAKEILSVAIHEHFKRMKIKGIEKSNILLVGPTGSGKTLFAKSLAELLGVPFTIADASALTEAGYIGQDVESILTPLIQETNGDISKVERSVVFIDEIDKLAKNDARGSDVSRTGVQQGLLKMLEGSVVSVPSNNAARIGRGVYVNVDTSNILFICGGAFPGLEKVVDRRKDNNSIGFFSTPLSNEEKKEKLYKEATTEDFESFGMLPEFMGRLPIIAFLDPLTVDTYRKILTEPKDSVLKQFQKSFQYDNATLTISDMAMDAIAEKAAKMGTGARALRSILNDLLRKPMYKLPSTKGKKIVIVTEDNVVNGTIPKIRVVDPDPDVRKA